MVLPTGIATDDTTKDFFGAISSKQSIVSLFDFENKEGIFPGVHRSFKFCLLTLDGSKVDKSNFASGAGSPSPVRTLASRRAKRCAAATKK